MLGLARQCTRKFNCKTNFGQRQSWKFNGKRTVDAVAEVQLNISERHTVPGLLLKAFENLLKSFRFLWCDFYSS